MSTSTDDKAVQANIYVRITTDHELELFTDETGANRLTNDSPISIRKSGKIGLRFIRNHNAGHHGPNIETADLIIIPQDCPDTSRASGRRKDNPFDRTDHKEWVVFLPDPAKSDDPGNLNGGVRPPAGSISIPAGTAKIRSDGEGLEYKFTVCALSDGGSWFDAVDPTIKIEA